MSREVEVFYPNKLTEGDLDSLESWQLLIAACHFGPTMGDCRVGNYGYKLADNGEIVLVGGDSSDDMGLKDDIDLDAPVDALMRFAVRDGWKGLAREVIKESVREVAS